MRTPKASSPRRARARTGIAAAALVLAGLLASEGCARLGLASFAKPELTFRGVELYSVGLDGATLDLLVDVYNPNAYRLGLEDLTYDLTVENVRWGSGQTTSPLSVEGRDSATLRLPLRIDWSRLGGLGNDVLQSGEVQYGVTGEVTVRTSMGTFRVPYDRTGRFSVFGGNRSLQDPRPARELRVVLRAECAPFPGPPRSSIFAKAARRGPSEPPARGNSEPGRPDPSPG